MNQLLFIIGDYLNGKLIYPPIRRILDFLFSVSIASFIFQKFYFRYQWIDITAYKDILDFLIKGYFFIPLSIFIVVHYSLYLISTAVFSITTVRRSNRYMASIINFRLKKRDIRWFSKMINKNPVVKLPVKFDEAFILNAYLHIKNTVDPEQWKKLEADVNKQKAVIESNFNLVFKALVVVTIYFITISHFGGLLYALVIPLLICGLAALWWLYLGIDLIPAAIQQFDREAQKYLHENQPIQDSNNIIFT